MRFLSDMYGGRVGCPQAYAHVGAVMLETCGICEEESYRGVPTWSGHGIGVIEGAGASSRNANVCQAFGGWRVGSCGVFPGTKESGCSGERDVQMFNWDG